MATDVLVPFSAIAIDQPDGVTTDVDTPFTATQHMSKFPAVRDSLVPQLGTTDALMAPCVTDPIVPTRVNDLFKVLKVMAFDWVVPALLVAYPR